MTLLPDYDAIGGPLSPPEYTPAVHHLSLVYYKQELPHTLSRWIPLLFEINSTQVNLYTVKHSQIVSYFFEQLSPAFVDPNLNIKSSKKPSKAASPTSYIPFNMANPPPMAVYDSEMSVSSLFSSRITPSQDHGTHSSGAGISIARLFNRFTSRRSKSEPSITLSEKEMKSQNYHYLSKLLSHRPNINNYLDTDYTLEEAQLLNFKGKHYMSFSLQELMKFGNASDFHDKPFTLRLIFTNDQFLVVSYNANTFASIFYKLNVARELSLDFDLRTVLPLDYCVPRRSRGNRNRRRNRSIFSIASTGSTGRGRSNSLLDDNADGDDEFDITFDDCCINQPTQYLQQPQVIIENELLSDICQLEPAHETLTTVSYNSRITTSSVFSSVERSNSVVASSSITSNSSMEISSLNHHKLPISCHPHDRYKELVVAVKCIKSCKNKTTRLK